MKVVHVNLHLAQKGGVETYLLSLLPLLKERNIEQKVIFSEGDASLFEGAIQVSGLESHKFGDQRGIRERVSQVLSTEKPDLIHVHNFQNIGLLQACLDYGTTIQTSHDYRTICPASLMFYKREHNICQRHSGLGCFTTTLTKHCLTPRPQYASYFYYRTKWVINNSQQYAHFITPSGSVKDRLIKAGFDSEAIQVLPYFCPMTPVEKPRTLPEKKTITYIGRVAEYKGYTYFVEALGQLPDDYHGLMVGNFTEENKALVRNLATRHGCEKRVELRPWATREEIPQIIDNTSVLVFPSLLPETLGIVGLEAFSRGVPVVAADVGGVREWLRDRENGVLVQPKSAQQIRDGILYLTENEEKLIKFGEKGIETINERFLPAHHTDKLIELYERCINK